MPRQHREILRAMTQRPQPAALPEGHDVVSPDMVKSVSRAMARAMSRAGEAFAGLDPDCSPPDFDWFIGLDQIEAALPEAGFLCLLDADDTQEKGIMALSQSFLDGLIEVQTTGRVDSVIGPTRRVTKIDTVLSQDFLDLLLGALSVELAPVSPSLWPARLHVGATMEDRNRVSLVLDEGQFHIWRVGVGLGGNIKQGEMVFALPARVPLGQAVQKGDTSGADHWQAAWHKTLGTIEIDLDAILYRRAMPLSQLEALRVGSVLPVLRSDLDALRLEDKTGRAALKGKLGQKAGLRAVKLSGEGLRAPKIPPTDTLSIPASTVEPLPASEPASGVPFNQGLATQSAQSPPVAASPPPEMPQTALTDALP